MALSPGDLSPVCIFEAEMEEWEKVEQQKILLGCQSQPKTASSYG
jgi:hypothetical protein